MMIYLSLLLLFIGIRTNVYAAEPSVAGLYTESLDGGIKLRWTSYHNPTSYTIKRSMTRDGSYTTIADNVIEKSYVDTGLENGKSYYYKVVPRNEEGIGVESEAIAGMPSESNYLWMDVYGHGARIVKLEVYDMDDNKIFYEASMINDPTETFPSDQWVEWLREGYGWFFNRGQGVDQLYMTRFRVKLKPHKGIKRINVHCGYDSPIKAKVYETVDTDLTNVQPIEEIKFDIRGKTKIYEILKSGLKAQGEDEEVYLTWNPVQEADTYTIKRSENESGPFTKIADNITQAEYVDRTVKNQKTYYYQVDGYSQYGNHYDLGTVHATTTKVRYVILDFFESYDCEDISIKEIELLDLNQNKIDFMVAESATYDTPIDYDSANTFYCLGHDYNLLKYAQDGNLETRTYLYHDLDNGEWARYALRLDENIGISKINFWADSCKQPKRVSFFTSLDYSYIDNLKYRKNKDLAFFAEQTIADADEVISYTFTQSAPQTPVGVNAISEDGRAKITWDKVDNAESYNVKRAVSAGGPYTVVARELLETEYIDFGLTNGKEYYYVVSAVNKGGEGADSQEVLVAPNQRIPQVPANVFIQSGEDMIELNWQSIYNAESYTIRRSETAGGPYQVIQEHITDNTYIDHELPFGMSYYYVITATNTMGESQYSQEACGIPGQAVPDKPENIISQMIGNKVYISWDAAHRAVSYKILRSDAEDGNYTLLKDSIRGISYEDSEVEADQIYYYKITAVNEKGESEPSDAVQAMVKQVNEQKIFLSITMKNGGTKEYILTHSELTKFMHWYQEKTEGKGLSHYSLMGKNRYGAYKSAKTYILFDSILAIDVKEIQEQ